MPYRRFLLGESLREPAYREVQRQFSQLLTCAALAVIVSCGRASAGANSEDGAGGTTGSMDSGTMDAEIDDTDPNCLIPITPFEFASTGPVQTADDSCELVYRRENHLQVSRADGSNTEVISRDVGEFELIRATGGVVYWNSVAKTAHYREAFGRGIEVALENAWSQVAPGLGLLVYALDVEDTRHEIWTFDFATRTPREILRADDYRGFLLFGPGLVYSIPSGGPFWASLTTSVRASLPGSPQVSLLAVDSAGTRAISTNTSGPPTTLALMDLESGTTMPLELPAPQPDWLSDWRLNLIGSFSEDGRFIRVDWCIGGQNFDRGSPRTELYETLSGEHVASIDHQFYYYSSCNAPGYPTTRTGILLPRPEGVTYFGFTGEVTVLSDRQNLAAYATKERDGNERWLITQLTDRGESTLLMTETAPGVFEFGPELAGGNAQHADDAGRWFVARPAGTEAGADSDQWVLIDVDSEQVLPLTSAATSLRVFAKGRALLHQESFRASVTKMPSL